MTVAYRGFRHVEPVMGTAVSFDVRTPCCEAAVRNAVDFLHWADETFSVYRADSQIYTIGRGELAVDDAHPQVRALDADGPGIGVDLQPAKAQRLAAARRIRPTQNGPQPRQQLPRLERFRQVVISPQLESNDAVHDFTACGEHDDGQRRLTADDAADLDAADLRQHQVEQHQVGRVVTHRGEHSVAAIESPGGKTALGLQVILQEGGDLGLVFDDQNGLLGHARSLSLADRPGQTARRADCGVPLYGRHGPRRCCGPRARCASSSSGRR